MTVDKEHTTTGAVLCGVLVLVSIGCHQSSMTPIQTLGTFCGLIALAIAWKGYSRLKQSAWTFKVAGRTFQITDITEKLLPPLFVVGLAVALLHPMGFGEMPQSRDHPVHLFKAWHFWEELLSQGRLRGWSSYWFFGYPAQELYPMGPDIWVAAFRAATFGILSWAATYAVAFVGAFALTAYAIYAFGQRHLGPLAGVVAAVLWLVDPGAPREGGWVYTVDFAVWGQILATGFLLLTFVRLDDVIKRGSAMDYAIASFFCAAALLTHPMNIILFALALPLYVMARLTLHNATKGLGKEATAIGAVMVIGVGLASFWLLPILARGPDWSVDNGHLWLPMNAIAGGLLDGTLFTDVWPFALFASFIGAYIGITQRRWTVLFLATLGLLLLFVSSSTTFQDWNLLAISKSFGKLQYQRFSIPSKACLYLLAGFAVSQFPRLLHTAKTAQTDPTPFWRQIAPLLIVAAIVAPFVRPGITTFHETHMKGVGELQTTDTIRWWNDYQAFLEWSAQERDGSDAFYRISYEFREHDHAMMDSPVYNNTPIHNVGYTPAKLFKHAPQTKQDALYKALSVKYVVTRRGLRRHSLEEIKKFGQVRVFRFKDYRPDRYTLQGQGDVETVEFGEERIHLRLSNISPDARLKLHVANYPRWRITMDGQELEPDEVPAFKEGDPILMEFPVRNGELVVEYVRRGADWLGLAISLLGLLTVVLLIVASRHSRTADWFLARFQTPTQAVVRLMPKVIGVAVVAVAVLLVYRWWTSSQASVLSGSVSTLLPKANVTYKGKSCDRWEDDESRWRCSQLDWHYIGPVMHRFDGVFIPCIWASPVSIGPIEITFPKTTLGRRTVGYHGIADTALEMGGAPVTMEVLIDGNVVSKVVRHNQRGWQAFDIDTSDFMNGEHAITVRVTTEPSGRWGHCFDLEINTLN